MYTYITWDASRAPFTSPLEFASRSASAAASAVFTAAARVPPASPIKGKGVWINPDC